MLLAALAPLAAIAYDVIAEWQTLAFDWPSGQAENDALASGDYIPKNNVITGLKICGPGVSERCTEEMIFPTVPRWRRGVPSSLVKLIRNGASGGAVLQPWPSLAANDPTDCAKLQYVQSMEIDVNGIMWVIDVGRKYFADEGGPDNSCPPKIVFIDVPTGSVLEDETYTFPADVCPYDGCFLNDIAVDVARQVGYISNTGNNASDPGGIIAYDRTTRQSRRFDDERLQAEHPPAGTVEIHGRDYSSLVGSFPADGIALHPNGERLYWSVLGARRLYSLDASLLRDFSRDADAARGSIQARPSLSDLGMPCAQQGGPPLVSSRTTDSRRTAPMA
jgi:hypothetical protein